MKKTLLVICALFVAAMSVNATEYYLIGSMNGWAKTVEPQYTFVLNEKAEGTEYMLTIDLKAGDKFKVISDTDEWFPGGGEENNYEVAADGKYDIYFRPGKDGGEDWHHKCIFMTASTPSAIGKAVVAGKAVKVVENGRIYIVRNGVRFNITGAVVE